MAPPARLLHADRIDVETRRPNPLPGNDTTLVSIDIATGKASDILPVLE
jgi:hypothetical protein